MTWKPTSIPVKHDFRQYQTMREPHEGHLQQSDQSVESWERNSWNMTFSKHTITKTQWTRTNTSNILTTQNVKFLVNKNTKYKGWKHNG